MSETTLQVRSARPTDIDALVEFNAHLALETESKQLDRETLRQGVSAMFAHRSRGFYLIAETAEAPAAKPDANSAAAPRVVAGLMVTYEWSDWRNGVFWWIQSVYVVPDYRRQGIYRQLFQTVQSLAAESDEHVCGYRLYVEKANEIAQRVYRQMGMQETPYHMYELNRS